MVLAKNVVGAFAMLACTTTSPETSGSGGTSDARSAHECRSPLVEGDATIKPFDGGDAPLGIFHTGLVDAENLELRPDGTFRWSLMACDGTDGRTGRWVAQGSTVMLLPDQAFANQIGKRVTGMSVVHSDAGLALRVWSDGSFRDEPLAPGGGCAICCIYVPQRVESCDRPWFPNP
jgi:hypothetical protein